MCGACLLCFTMALVIAWIWGPTSTLRCYGATKMSLWLLLGSQPSPSILEEAGMEGGCWDETSLLHGEVGV